jgi:hypothetical protein
MHDEQSALAKRMAPAYRIGYETIWMERQARFDWLDAGEPRPPEEPDLRIDGIRPLSARPRSILELIDEKLLAISRLGCHPDLDALRAQYLATLGLALSELESGWGTSDHREIFDENYIEYCRPSDEDKFKKSPFGKGVWALIDQNAEAYRDCLPSDLCLSAELGMNIALVMLACVFNLREPLRGRPIFPIETVKERLSQLSGCFPLTKDFSDEFARDYTEAAGHAGGAVDREWAYFRVRKLNADIGQLLESAIPHGASDEQDWL